MIVYYVQRYISWSMSWIRVSPPFCTREEAIDWLHTYYDVRYSRDSFRIKEML